jgi:ABC-2 type transport system permease protein
MTRMPLHNVFVAEVRMLGWELKRYLFNTGAMVVVMYVLFLGMFWGVKSIGGPGISSVSLDAMVIGYVLWMSALFALQGTGGVVQSESERGTLEQLYLSPYGAEVIFFFKSVTATLFNFLLITLMLYLTMLTTGRMLPVNLLFFYPVLFVSVLSLTGIGFMLGGIGLVHKRIGAVNGLLSFGLIGLMLLPVYPLNGFSFIPFLAGAHTITEHIVNGASFPLWWYLFVAANSVFYLWIGLVVFRIFERKARSLNKMGQY